MLKASCGFAPGITRARSGLLHHGSRSSIIPVFFAALKPKDTMISVGKNNTLGKPSQGGYPARRG